MYLLLFSFLCVSWHSSFFLCLPLALSLPLHFFVWCVMAELSRRFGISFVIRPLDLWTPWPMRGPIWHHPAIYGLRGHPAIDNTCARLLHSPELLDLLLWSVQSALSCVTGTDVVGLSVEEMVCQISRCRLTAGRLETRRTVFCFCSLDEVTGDAT